MYTHRLVHVSIPFTTQVACGAKTFHANAGLYIPNWADWVRGIAGIAMIVSAACFLFVSESALEEIYK